MCDPMTIAGIALTGLSTGLNAAAQSNIQGARDDAMAAERIRQRGYDNQADAINTQSRERYADFEGQQADKSGQLADYFTSQDVAEPSAEAALPTSASNITVREENKQRGAAKDFTDKTGTALGELRSFGDLLGGISRLQARDAGTIGQLGGFKRGSSNVLGLELDNANNAGNGMKMFADIAGGLGSIGTSAGLSGGNLGGLFKSSDPWAGMRSAGGGSLFSLFGR